MKRFCLIIVYIFFSLNIFSFDLTLKREVSIVGLYNINWIERVLIIQDELILPVGNKILKVNLLNNSVNKITQSSHDIFNVEKISNDFFFVSGAPDWRFLYCTNDHINLDVIDQYFQNRYIVGNIFKCKEKSLLFSTLETNYEKRTILSKILLFDPISLEIEELHNSDEKIKLLGYDEQNGTIFAEISDSKYVLLNLNTNEKTYIDLDGFYVHNIIYIDNNTVLFTEDNENIFVFQNGKIIDQFLLKHHFLFYDIFQKELVSLTEDQKDNKLILNIFSINN